MEYIHYAGLIKNDVVNGQDVCVSLWCQGCPIRCEGCHNAHTWDENGGKEISINNLSNIILHSLGDNGVIRNFSVLGGEPQADYNKKAVRFILERVREQYPDIQVFLWTGFTFENLLEKQDEDVLAILGMINVQIEGPFIMSQRDITLPLRGSTNQRILNISKSQAANAAVEEVL